MEQVRKINYCWFGGAPLGELEQRCVASWRRYLPGYEIVRWDESNFDLHCCRYVEEAYCAKKWAFVSDYARFKILYEEGGLYFDTDVELIAPIDDIIERGPFMGCQYDGANIPWEDLKITCEDGKIDTALLGAPGRGAMTAPGLGLMANPGLGLYKAVLDSYEKDLFVNPDGSLNQTTVVVRVTNLMIERGLKNEPGIQEVAGVTVYPAEYFNPKDYRSGIITTTANTRAIHHFSMSWLTPAEQKEHDRRAALLRRGLSMGAAGRLAKVATILETRDFNRVAKKIKKTLNRKRG